MGEAGFVSEVLKLKYFVFQDGHIINEINKNEK
jgi:hypothetical protein